MRGAGFAMAMVAAFLLNPEYAVLGGWTGLDTLLGGDITAGLIALRAQLLAFGVIVLAIVLYFVAKRAQQSKDINVDFAFKEIPPE